MELNMKPRRLSWLDHVRLSNLVRAPRADARLTAHTVELAEEVLDLADQVDPRSIPRHVVTMRSRVVLASAGDRSMAVTLSYPGETSAQEGRLSVFSPLGLSLLGAEVGEVIRWSGPDGEEHTATVVDIPFQPEAAGDFTT
ncbi:nucleoside-diphosphate kinase [Roseateles aquatilis]|uniref:Nucleoside-diphosphate kinase n=1 Tax=Roseateles aquatilis TaxID=431061 RepID=A0A246IVY0_9BURK|nr:GreA/GreB family elongation factor [Roseateles aquatilis]OWQ84382.1 nucleoside-diphosphate kinase [Roseateles aquatilis]